MSNENGIMRNESLRVYFYHTQDTQSILRAWREGRWMGHLLYGATHFPEMGVGVEWHRHAAPAPGLLPRLRRGLLTAWRVLRLGSSIDAVFATHYQGIEPLLLLRAAGLYAKPIVLWVHQPLSRPRSPLRRAMARMLYKGADAMILFSQDLVDTSRASGMAAPGRLRLGHWGADLRFYSRLAAGMPSRRSGFISSGKEMRDIPTLLTAFARAGASLDLYLPPSCGDTDYGSVVAGATGGDPLPPNISLHLGCQLSYPEIAAEVSRHACVCVCCRETSYTAGLTTVVEALALGLPILSSRNPHFPFDIDREGVGITLPYGDADAWQRAICYIGTHPAEAAAMGRRGRQLAERLYNDRQTATEVVEIIRQLAARKKQR